MKNSILKAAILGILLIILCSLPMTSTAQSSQCDFPEFCGGGSVDGAYTSLFDTFCNSTPQDLVCHPGWPDQVNVTCHGCLQGNATHQSSWEHAGTSACSSFEKTLVITFSEPVADVDIGVYGAKTVTDNTGYTVRLNPTLNANGRLNLMRVFLPGPGITSITLSDPLEFPVYYENGSILYDPAAWDIGVSGWGGNFWYVPDRIYNQCNCNRPIFTRPNPQSAFSPDWNGNAIPDWRMDVDVSDDDGLVLKNIRLENRYMAEQISVPYYWLETNTINPAARGELKPASGDPSMASRLVNYNVWNDEEKLVVEATYVIGQIPAGSANCLEIIQRYEFHKSVAGDKCEPSGTLPCARWKPIVRYNFRGPAGEFHNISIAQRQHRTVDNNPYNSVGLFRDNDTILDIALSGFNGFGKWCNPLPHEWTGQIVKGGKDGQVWDNVHQTYKAKVDEPYPSLYSFEQQKWFFVNPGCPECVHSHWRWGSLLGGEGGGGLIGIPFGSTQDLDFGIVLYRGGEEDPIDYHDLLGPTPDSIRTANTSGRDPLQIRWGSSPEDIVYWQSATGRQNQDTFFSYGAFFNPALPEQHLVDGAGSSSLKAGAANSISILSSEDGITSIVAAQIYATGSTNTTPFDANLGGSLPAGYSQYSDLSYKVTTTAEASGPYITTFSIPSVTDQATFDSLRIFHLEQDPFDPNAVIWIDRTLLPPDPQQPNFASRTLNARVNSLGQFVVASLTQPQPPNTGVADIGVSMTESQDPLVVGNDLTYNITVANSGPQAATGLVFSNALSPHVKFVSVASSQGNCSEVEGTVVCKLGSLAASGNATVTIVAKPTESRISLPLGGISIINGSLAKADEVDPNSANNTATENTTLLPDSNAAPTIEIISPTAGGLFVGPASITINATANDSDGSVSQVDFYGDGNLIGAGILGNPNQYGFTWTNAPFGMHVLVAVAIDNAGKASASDPITILVNGSAEVSVTNPGNGAVFNRPTNITITANASLSGGSISKVDFYEDGFLLGMGTLTGPNQYTLTWNAAPSGKHVLTAVATDTYNITSTSTPVYITVNDPPVISLNAPAGGTVFSPAPANITLTANSSDWEGSVIKVDFYANGLLIGTKSSHGVNQFDLTWSNVAAGSYSLTAVATDNQGATKTSVPITVRVNAAPTVSVIAPSNGSQFTTPANITLTANAADPDGSVSKVDFFANGYRVGSGAAIGGGQYSFTWTGVGIGNYSFTAVATDSDGATAPSGGPSVTVTSPVLLIAGSTTLNSTENTVKARLEALNHTVIAKSAASVVTADANGKALVVISSTVTPASVGTKFRSVAVPVLTWESGIYNNMGMTGSTNKDFGTKTNQTQVSVTDSTHPLAAGFSGTTTVASSGTFNWGKPNANASSVAIVVGDTAKTVIFGYAAGAVMPGLTAPARRVGFFMHDTTVLNSSGTQLLDSAIGWARGGGSLTGSLVISQGGSVDLTAEGIIDWAHWGLGSPTNFDHKAGIMPQVSNYTKLGSSSVMWLNDNPTTFSWIDGTPTASILNTPTGVFINGIAGNGFEITLPADANLKTLKLYLGLWYAQGKLEATLSDGSALAYVDTGLNGTEGTKNGVYTILFKAGSSGQTLKLRYTMLTNHFAPYGNVTLEAATLQ